MLGTEKRLTRLLKRLPARSALLTGKSSRKLRAFAPLRCTRSAPIALDYAVKLGSLSDVAISDEVGKAAESGHAAILRAARLRRRD